MSTAFQVGAFQFSGFQEAGERTFGGAWGWYDYWRARQSYLARERKRREEEAPEPVMAYAPARVRLSIIARPIYTDLSGLAARIAPTPANDLEEFRAFMQMVAELPVPQRAQQEQRMTAASMEASAADVELAEFRAFMESLTEAEEA